MDRQQAGNILEHRIEVVHRPQQDREHPSGPSVDVKSIRNPQQFGTIQHRTAKQPKSLRVVGIIAGGRLIEKLPIEELRAIDEINLHSVWSASIDDRHKAVVVRKRNGQTANRNPALL